VLSRFGLDWAALSADHPELVMLSISGFGQDGPEVARAAYAGVMHAESGLLDRQARTTGSRADDLQLSVADTNAGLHGLVGILSALRVRDQTGVGQYIDIAMIDSLLVCDDYVNHAFEGVGSRRGGGEVWETPHGGVIVMGDFKWVWKCANEILGLEDPTPPGASLDDKIRLRRDAWTGYVASFPSREDLLAALERANLAWGLVKTAEEAIRSPTLDHRDSLVEIPDPYEGVRTVVQSPYRFSHSESGVTGPAPYLGEHNERVLGDWLGFDPAAVTELESTRVLHRDDAGRAAQHS
jgi:crotonobetainyl-CoA:carnitine CoA-transferase CaiB-like acyl-CoA transferase